MSPHDIEDACAWQASVALVGTAVFILKERTVKADLVLLLMWSILGPNTMV